MARVSYKLEGQEEQILGDFNFNSSGKLEILVDATSSEEAFKKMEDIGRLNNAIVYVDGKQVNYQDFYASLSAAKK